MEITGGIEKKKAFFKIEQEGTISGELEPGECKYHIVQRATGAYLVIITRDDKGVINVESKKIKG